MGTSKIRAEVTFEARKPYNERSEWERGANGWTVTLRYQGRKLTTDYWTGSAITSDPTAADVFSSLMSDAVAGALSFQDFCLDLGYDEDSRSAYATWEACKRTERDLRRFLGVGLFGQLSRQGVSDPSELETDDDGAVLVRA